jgi:hypothetical protein
LGETRKYARLALAEAIVRRLPWVAAKHVGNTRMTEYVSVPGA